MISTPTNKAKEIENMSGEDLRTAARKSWGLVGSSPTHNELTLGSLLRIADATEAMAKNYTRLIEERDRFERWYEQERKSVLRLSRQVSAYKGQITKAKRAAVAKASA